MDWPRFGPATAWPRLNGHTDTLPDLIGPLDGSARLTILTEGNHFPALLPLLFDEYPAWCAARGGPAIAATEILAATLPQYLLLTALDTGGLALGNAILPLAPHSPAFPDIVMASPEGLDRLARQGLIQPEALVFARHLGPALLLRRGAGLSLSTLPELASRQTPLMLPTPAEKAARQLYLDAVASLAGPKTVDRLLENEVRDFPGRLGIQHRDVPYALAHGLADAGIIFNHLALYYARTFPDTLAYAPIPGAEGFGREIALAPTIRPDSPPRAAFLEFFLETAAKRYPAHGFAPASSFAYGRKLALGAG